MRWSLVLAGILLVSAGVLAGCLSPTSEDDPTSESGSDDPSTGTVWETTTRSGTVSGVGTPVGSVSQGGGNTATWTVPEDTRVLYINVTTEGGELSVDYGPDCDTQDTVECEHSASTSEGELSEVVEAPQASGWEAYLFLENNAGEVDWELAATMGVVQG